MERTDAIIDGFRQAAVGMMPWTDAIDALARPVGAHAAQLGAVDAHGTLVFNVMANVSDEEVAAYMARGGPDPVVNIRNQAIIRARPLICLTEEDFATPAIVTTAPIYRELFIPYDVPHVCMARLHQDGGDPTAIALLRSARRGHADRDARRLVEAVAPALAGAVRTARTIGHATKTAILATAEALAGPAILLGPALRIVSLSPAAEALLRTGTHLGLRAGRLVATMGSGVALEAGFAAVAARDAAGRGNVPLVLQGAGGAEPLLAELAPLPPRSTGSLSRACALLTIRAPRPAPCSAETLAAAFGLTPAESAVGLLLAEGLDLAAIAARRGCTVNTVRNQLKALMDKTGTRRQAELVVRIRRY